jgi:hypothetical protein
MAKSTEPQCPRPTHSVARQRNEISVVLNALAWSRMLESDRKSGVDLCGATARVFLGVGRFVATAPKLVRPLPAWLIRQGFG